MFFSVITENLNWEILTNYLLLIDGMVLRMKNFNMGVHEKIWFLWGGFTKKQYLGDIA